MTRFHLCESFSGGDVRNLMVLFAVVVPASVPTICLLDVKVGGTFHLSHVKVVDCFSAEYASEFNFIPALLTQYLGPN